MNRFRRRCKEPEAVGDLLKAVLKKSGLEKKIREYDSLTQWPAIVGEKIAEQTAPVEIRNGVLFVQVKNAAWRTELAFFKDDIIQKINTHAGKRIVRSIFFT